MRKSKVADERWDIQYKVDYSSRYHRKRSTFLGRCDTMMTAMTLAAGAAAVGDLADNVPTAVLKIGAATVAIISVIQITTRVSEATFQHREWMKRWIKLGNDVRKNPAPSPEEIATWQLEVSSIESECVSEFRTLRLICEDESARYFAIEGRQHKIGFFQKLFANIGSFQQSFKLIDHQS